MAHLVKKFYLTTQDALHEASTYRKRNERLDYALNSAIDKVQVANAEMTALRAEIKRLEDSSKNNFSAGYRKGVGDIRQELKVIKN